MPFSVSKRTTVASSDEPSSLTRNFRNRSQRDRAAGFERRRHADQPQIHLADMGAVAELKVRDRRECGVDALVEIALADAGELELEHPVRRFHSGQRASGGARPRRETSDRVRAAVRAAGKPRSARGRSGAAECKRRERCRSAFGSTSAPTGTSACLRFASAIGRPRSAKNASSDRSAASSRINSKPDHGGGDFPRQVVAGRAESAGDDQHVGAVDRLGDGLGIASPSGTVVWRAMRRPSMNNSRPNHAAWVFTVFPSRSSVPVLRISMRMRGQSRRRSCGHKNGNAGHHKKAPLRFTGAARDIVRGECVIPLAGGIFVGIVLFGVAVLGLFLGLPRSACGSP